MKLWYNAVAIHDLGRVSLTEESTTLQPEDAPQKESLTLTLRVDTWERGSYVDNRTILLQVKDALTVQNAQLKLLQEAVPGTESESDLTMFDQMATIVSHNFPSDPNEWGVHHGRLVIVFKLERHNLTTNGLTATCTPTTGAPVNLGSVFRFKEGYQVEHFSKLVDPREHIGGTVTMTGEFLGDMSMTLANRRAALTSTKNAWIVSMLKKDCRIQYGSVFDQTVRIAAFDADIDQATSKVVWSLTGFWTKFPNETGYAVVEYTVGTKLTSEGELTLSFSGTVKAETEIRATTKLAAIRTAILAANGFTTFMRKGADSNAKTVSTSQYDQQDADSGDGSAFTELSFSEEYSKQDPDYLTWSLTVDDQEDVSSGLLTRTYSGSVSAGYTGATKGVTNADKAYSLAVDQARSLGDNKHDVKMTGSIKRDDHTLKRDGIREFTKLNFSFSYRIRGSRIYMEAKTDVHTQAFGEDTESVSGFIVGPSDASIASAYSVIRSAYSARLVRNEVTAWSKNMIRNGSSTGLTSNDFSPSALFRFQQSGAANADSGYTTLVHRYDFQFEALKAKPTGTYAIKYGIQIAKEIRTLTKTIQVNGTMFGTEALMQAAVDESEGNKLDELFGYLNLGVSLTRTRTVDREFAPGIPDVNDHDGTGVGVNFSETFESAITGYDQILECEVNEDIVFSGVRNVIQALPDRAAIIQQCGITEARRTLSGSVTAATETIALKWIKRQQATPYIPAATIDDATGVPDVPAVEDRYQEPVKIKVGYVFVPLTDGEVRGEEGQGAKLVKATFEFSEIIPNYEYV
jgi:hypothetical protein